MTFIWESRWENIENVTCLDESQTVSLSLKYFHFETGTFSFWGEHILRKHQNVTWLNESLEQSLWDEKILILRLEHFRFEANTISHLLNATQLQTVSLRLIHFHYLYEYIFTPYINIIQCRVEIVSNTLLETHTFSHYILTHTFWHPRFIHTFSHPRLIHTFWHPISIHTFSHPISL